MDTVVPALSIVTRCRIISAQPSARLITTTKELALRRKLAFLQCVIKLPNDRKQADELEEPRTCRSTQPSPVVVPPMSESMNLDECCGNYFSKSNSDIDPTSVTNLRLLQVYGKCENIKLAKGCEFYRRPWGAPLLAAVDAHKIVIESNTFVHNSTQLLATGGAITLGQHCSISWRTALLTEFHVDESSVLRGNIVLEDQVWVGAMAILLPDTNIGKGCVVAAGSVVQGAFPAFSVIAGNPAIVKGTICQFDGSHGYGVQKCA